MIWLWANLGDQYDRKNWVEPNGLQYLFYDGQKWTRDDARTLVSLTWGWGTDMQSPGKALRITVTVATALYTALLFVSGIELPGMTRKAVGLLPSTLGIGLVVFDRWAWRWRFVHRVVGRPRLDGTWWAIVEPDPAGRKVDGGNRGPIEAVVTIEQTYWTVNVRQSTAESSSSSS